MRKQTVLKNIEKSIMESSNYETNIDYSKPKYFTTFCYPYMNGKLHLGHAFTMLKADYDARYKQINGYNVLFPFGFHCTGMPIHAAAMKLKKEFDTNTIQVSNKVTQYDILKKSGIVESEINKFTDPYHWVKYFPNLGMEHLQKLGVMVDKRRSFVTTDINPFYDSFIKYQFNKLYKMDYLKYGTRNSIYSPSLDIQCQDHDRSKGEGVQTGEFKVCVIDNFWIPYECTFENQKQSISKISISSNTSFNVYEFESEKVYMTKYIYDNYFSQSNKELKLIEENVKISESTNENINIVKKHTNNYSSYLGGEVIFGDKDNIKTCNINLCLPTDLVIDRMDKVCIVKPIPQWYIDYANVEWKDKTLKYIESMKLTDSIHDKLVSSVKWLKEWGVSRSFGLGTKLPMDENYVIDSLSDSTIYMAYYTICHLIHNDIYGHESKYSPEDFTEQVWDYIFFKKWDESIKISKNELDLMNQSFEYFYPVDVRISGKDLIPNHLCMYIFNHIAIFGEDKSPITINCNGWILVNGEKMAKSKGNFITVDEETEKNSLDAIRLTLAESGDGIDDANYITKTTEETNTLKLFTFVEQIEKYNPEDYDNTELDELDVIFQNVFNKIIKETLEYYESNRYKMVVSSIFHIYNNVKEKYRIFCKYFGKKQNKKLFESTLKNQLVLLYPIIPHISTYLYENIMKFGSIKEVNIKKELIINIDDKIISNFEYVENIVSTIREKVTKLKKKNKPVNKITIHCKVLTDFEKKLVQHQIKNEIEFIVEEGKVIINIS